MNIQNAIELGLAERIQIVDSQNVDLFSCDEGLSIEAYLDGKKIGEMLFGSLEEPFSYGTQSFIKLCSMELDEDYRRQGIGTAMLKLAIRVSDQKVVASCPSNTQELSDGSHLIGIGPVFVEEMRKAGLILRGCCDPCFCQDGESPEEDY